MSLEDDAPLLIDGIDFEAAIVARAVDLGGKQLRSGRRMRLAAVHCCLFPAFDGIQQLGNQSLGVEKIKSRLHRVLCCQKLLLLQFVLFSKKLTL